MGAGSSGPCLSERLVGCGGAMWEGTGWVAWWDMRWLAWEGLAGSLLLSADVWAGAAATPTPAGVWWALALQFACSCHAGSQGQLCSLGGVGGSEVSLDVLGRAGYRGKGPSGGLEHCECHRA